MAEAEDIDVMQKLPSMDLDLNNLHDKEDDLFLEIPGLSQEMSRPLDADFKRLNDRHRSTSTPFLPRSTVSHETPAWTMYQHWDDSGYDPECSILWSGSNGTYPTPKQAGNLSTACTPLQPPPFDFLIPSSSDKPQWTSLCNTGHLSKDTISDSRPSVDLLADSQYETDSAYDEASSLCSVQSQTLSETFSTTSDSQAMDIVFQALDLNSSGYSSRESSRYCSQHNLSVSADAVHEAAEEDQCMPSESESSNDSQQSVVEMVCIKLEQILPSFSKVMSDRLIGRKMGLEKVDIMGELHNRAMTSCLSLIFEQLSPKDLYSVSRVSRSWRKCLDDDKTSRHRKLSYLKDLKSPTTEKENQTVLRKAIESEHRVQRGLTCTEAPLAEIQHSTPVAALPGGTHSTLERFVRQAHCLKRDESLRKCPRCQHPAKAHAVQDRAICSNSECGFDFCVKCLGGFHGSRDCSFIPGSGGEVGVNKKARTDVKIGSRKSKRNLRRL